MNPLLKGILPYNKTLGTIYSATSPPFIKSEAQGFVYYITIGTRLVKEIAIFVRRV